jgi:hypothetical protein
MNLKLSLATILATTTLWFSPPAQAQPTRSIGSGVTTVRLDTTFLRVLRDENIRTRAFEESVTARNSILFPINEGTIDLANARGEIIHAGGVRFTSPSVNVKLVNPKIDTTLTPVLLALVIVNDQVIERLPIFDVKFSGLSTPLKTRKGTLRFTNVTLTLRSEGATALNTVFDTDAFSAGQTFGTATVNAILGRSKVARITVSSQAAEE